MEGEARNQPPRLRWGSAVLVLPPRLDEIGYLRSTFPGGSLTEIRSEGTTHGLLGSVYEVPPPPSWRHRSLTNRRDDEVGDLDPICLDGS